MLEFVLEIGTEEMPARFQPGLGKELKDALTLALNGAKIDFQAVQTFTTPRRITAFVSGMASAQEQTEEVFTGPPKRVAYSEDGEPSKAALGFAKAQGVSMEETFILKNEKGEYLAVRRLTGGGATVELLPDICKRVVSALSFPKKMRWGNRDFSFGRPIRWLFALFDDAPIEFEIAGIESGRETFGHRVMGHGPWTVKTAKNYFEVLKTSGRVILDPEERREAIVSQGDALAKEAKGRVVWKKELLNEVRGLAERPKAVIGDFEPDFLELPREALLTTIQRHQKCFGIEDPDEKLIPRFICVLDIEPRDLGLVRKGWERVLRARLFDARFFWKTDLAVDLDTWLARLENVIFLGPLGSMGQKSRRLERLCAWLAKAAGGDDSLIRDLSRAGRLAKADLVSEMVKELDELQGIMGGIYAAKKGESENTAGAIYEHYLPAGPNTPVPPSLAGALLAVADRADALAGCFGLNMIPTGAADPHALRRQALGICRILMEHELRLDLDTLLEEAIAAYGSTRWKLGPGAALEKLREFFSQRLKAYFTSQGFDTLVVEAALGAGFNDVWALWARIRALDAFHKRDDFEMAALTFKRAANIIIKQGQEAGQELTGNYQRELLQENQEIALAEKIEEVAPRWDKLWERDEFAELLTLLRELRPLVDDFFDHVMVMCEDQTLRVNRLNLLKSLVDRLGRLADFNALQI